MYEVLSIEVLVGTCYLVDGYISDFLTLKDLLFFIILNIIIRPSFSCKWCVIPISVMEMKYFISYVLLSRDIHENM